MVVAVGATHVTSVTVTTWGVKDVMMTAVTCRHRGVEAEVVRFGK